jgi:outer membrane protein OmpA-like peptidoglycan-associated protein
MKILALQLIILLLGEVNLLLAQAAPEIAQIDELIISIRLNRGDVLLPEKFQKFKEQFDRLKNIGLERSFTQVEIADLNQLQNLFEAIYKTSEFLKPYFNSTLEARDEALNNSADDFAPQHFRVAEENLRKLANQYLKSMPADPNGRINQAIILYRHAQFVALKNKLLSEVRILYEESKDLDAQKLTPISFRVVTALIKEVETIIEEKRYEDNTLSTKASQLLRESQHLLHLVQLAQRMKRDASEFEAYMMELEERIAILAILLDLEPQFVDGVSNYLIEMESSLQAFKEENQNLKNVNEALSDSLSNRNSEIKKLRAELENQDSFVRRVENLQKSLKSHGVNVIQEPNQIVLRLNGIEFPPGKLQINQSARLKLEKIGQSLRAFPSHKVTVRLGQSVAGNRQYSKSLAEQRAKAVALVIQAAGFIKDERLRTEGVIIEYDLSTGHAIIDVIVETD